MKYTEYFRNILQDVSDVFKTSDPPASDLYLKHFEKLPCELAEALRKSNKHEPDADRFVQDVWLAEGEPGESDKGLQNLSDAVQFLADAGDVSVDLIKKVHTHVGRDMINGFRGNCEEVDFDNDFERKRVEK